MAALKIVNIKNNPIPGAYTGALHEELLKELQPKSIFTLTFKSYTEEMHEQALFRAIRAGKKVNVRNAFADAAEEHQDISKIRDAKGNNLLHAVINGLAQMKRDINKSDGTYEENQKKIAVAEREYLQLFMKMIQFGGPAVENMFLARNSAGENVLSAAIQSIGPDSYFTQAILAFAYAKSPEQREAVSKRFNELDNPAQTPASMPAINVSVGTKHQSAAKEKERSADVTHALNISRLTPEQVSPEDISRRYKTLLSEQQERKHTAGEQSYVQNSAAELDWALRTVSP